MSSDKGYCERVEDRCCEDHAMVRGAFFMLVLSVGGRQDATGAEVFETGVELLTLAAGAAAFAVPTFLGWARLAFVEGVADARLVAAALDAAVVACAAVDAGCPAPADDDRSAFCVAFFIAGGLVPVVRTAFLAGDAVPALCAAAVGPFTPGALLFTGTRLLLVSGRLFGASGWVAAAGNRLAACFDFTGVFFEDSAV
mmetsp:Transcript_67404/g.112867  ORF Transcript_67404/g.112867 Transcript_67404/m.112867 type:complete len:198 (+) Transcript_67404:707-1300(+)